MERAAKLTNLCRIRVLSVYGHSYLTRAGVSFFREHCHGMKIMSLSLADVVFFVRVNLIVGVVSNPLQCVVTDSLHLARHAR